MLSWYKIAESDPEIKTAVLCQENRLLHADPEIKGHTSNGHPEDRSSRYV